MKRHSTALIMFGAIAGCVVIGVGLFALFLSLFGDPGSIQPARPVVVGARVDQGKLTVAFGCQPAPGSTVDILFTTRVPLEPNNNPYLQFISDGSMSVLDPFAMPNDVELVSAPLDWFMWQQAVRMYVSVDVPDSGWGFYGIVEFGDLSIESSLHPPGEFFFGQAGWLTPDEVAARDGVDLMTVCSPSPPR